MKLSNFALRSLCAIALGAGIATTASAGSITGQQASQLQAGMTKEQVASILGQPDRAETYALSNKTDWTYGYDDVYYDSSAYVVDFDQSGRLESSYEVDTATF